MNNNNIKLSIILIIISLTIYTCSCGLQKPEINIKKTSKNQEKNKYLYTYKIKISANDNLKYFVILPSIKGLNCDSKIVYAFKEKTRYAELDYFYLRPNNTSMPKAVKLLLQIGTDKGCLRKMEMIVL